MVFFTLYNHLLRVSKTLIFWVLFCRDDLQKAPDKIDSYLSSRMFLPAVRLLVASLRSLHGVECAEVGALDAIRQRLTEVKEVGLCLFSCHIYSDLLNEVSPRDFD